MLIHLIVVTVSQCMHISDQVVHLKYIQFLIVNYTLIKLEKKYWCNLSLPSILILFLAASLPIFIEVAEIVLISFFALYRRQKSKNSSACLFLLKSAF